MGYSETSKERLSTCDNYIQKVLNRAIEICPIDFGIAQGARTVQQQQQYFNEGKSKVNPEKYSDAELPLKGKHIVNELYPVAGAVDVYAYIPGKGASWDASHLCVIAGVIISIDKSMDNKLRWGGNWDMDGESISDQSFQDLPHFELVKR